MIYISKNAGICSKRALTCPSNKSAVCGAFRCCGLVRRTSPTVRGPFTSLLDGKSGTSASSVIVLSICVIRDDSGNRLPGRNGWIIERPRKTIDRLRGHNHFSGSRKADFTGAPRILEQFVESGEVSSSGINWFCFRRFL